MSSLLNGIFSRETVIFLDFCTKFVPKLYQKKDLRKQSGNISRRLLLCGVHLHGVLIHRLHDVVGLPAAHLLDLFVGIALLVEIAGEEVAELMQRELRNACALLSFEQILVKCVRVALVDIPLRTDPVSQIGRNDDITGALRGLRGFNNIVFIFVLNHSLVDVHHAALNIVNGKRTHFGASQAEAAEQQSKLMLCASHLGKDCLDVVLCGYIRRFFDALGELWSFDAYVLSAEHCHDEVSIISHRLRVVVCCQIVDHLLDVQRRDGGNIKRTEGGRKPPSCPRVLF